MNTLAPIKRWLSGPSPARAPAGFHSHPDTALVHLGGNDALRVRDMFEGVQIVGGTGSGKSSGSGKTIAHAMLSAGWGGLVLCAKPDEADRWVGYLRATGRAAHLIRVTPGGPYTINFLDYELHRPDGGGGETFNLVALMDVMVAATAMAQGPSTSGESGSFWTDARNQLLRNATSPLVAATGCFRLNDLMRMVTSAPTTREEAFSDEWKARSFCYQVLRASFEAPLGRALSINEVQVAADYWFNFYAGLDPKTRSNIIATLTSAIDPFLRGMLHDNFCTRTTVIPELTHQGAVIVWDFPVKVWGAAAVVATQMMKYQWQKAAERRVLDRYTRPIFLFADECQFFLADYDAEFQSTARSAMAATVYITQNLPTYYSRLRTRDAKSTADSLLGNFQTKIFHANTDATTNQYAADLIGKTIQNRRSSNWSVNQNNGSSHSDSANWNMQRGTSRGRNAGSNHGYSVTVNDQGQNTYGYSGGSSVGRQSGTSRSRSHGGGWSAGTSESLGSSDGGGWSEQMDYTVQPVAFASRLRKGGDADGGLVDGVIVQGGRRFEATGAHWLFCTFRQ